MIQIRFQWKSCIKTAVTVERSSQLGTAPRMTLYHAANALKLRIYLGNPRECTWNFVLNS